MSRLDPVFQRLLGDGWAAHITYRLGLQGSLRIGRHEFSLGRDADRRPINVAFAVDFHAGSSTDERLLATACDMLERLRPDLLLLGGDFVAFQAHEIRDLARRLRRIKAPLGKFAVLGNHDIAAGTDGVAEQLESAGVKVLRNESVRLPAPHDDVELVGLDDPIFGHPEAPASAGGLHRLILMHAPDGLLALQSSPFAVALCGHTHGGQVALPGGTPIIVPRGRLSRRYSRGVYDLADGGKLLVSRGVGCAAIPVRLFSPPELHLCVLR